MSAAAVLVELVDAGATLATDEGGALALDAPAPLPRPLLARARAARAGLLVVASGAWRAELAGWPEPLRAIFEERAAIREFEGGQPRELAEPAAYLDVRDLAPTRPAGA